MVTTLIVSKFLEAPPLIPRDPLHRTSYYPTVRFFEKHMARCSQWTGNNLGGIFISFFALFLSTFLFNLGLYFYLFLYDLSPIHVFRGEWAGPMGACR